MRKTHNLVPGRTKPAAFMTLGAVLALVASLAPGTPLAPAAAVGGSAVGDVASVTLQLLGRSDLAVPGLDGVLKPRGNNGDLAVLKDTAYVGGGAVFHGAQGSPGRVCTDWGGVKVVDLADPARPRVRTTITMVDNLGAVVGPVGNPRRGLKLDNVSVSAAALDARTVSTPTFSGDVLAIATQRCEPGVTTDGRIEFWDVTNPGAPARLGIFATAANNNGWGIYEDVRMFTRNNGPGGSAKLYAIATLPFHSNGNDVRVVDITDLRAPVEVPGSGFPVGDDDLDFNSVNICKPYVAGRSAAPSPDGSRAVVSLFDGTTTFGTNPSAVISYALDSPPRQTPGSNPPAYAAPPNRYETTLNPAFEGNFADVEPFDAAGSLRTIVSEDDIDPSLTNLTVTGPGFTAFDGRVCEILVGKRVYEYPGQRLQAPYVWGGLACGPQTLANATTLAPEPPPFDVRGAIVVGEQGSGCTAQERLEYLQTFGAMGVVQGSAILDTFISGSEGGYPSAPNVVVPTPAATAVQLAPSPVVTGNTFPTTYTRTTTATSVTTTAATAANGTTLTVAPLASGLAVGTNLVFPGNVNKVVNAAAAPGATSVTIVAAAGAVASGATGLVTNVTVRPRAVAVTAATNAAPIVITTAAHGLTTGDRVAITEVGGTTAANGTFTVTVLSATTFSLNGSTGNGAYTGGGYVVFCPPSNPGCTAAPTRTDRSRYQSVAGAADRAASAQTAVASRFDVVAGRSYTAGATLEVLQRVAGSFRAAVIWYNGAGGVVSESEIANLAAVTPVTRFNQAFAAPAGAVKGGLKFEWTGATAEGIAYAQFLTTGPANLQATFTANKGEWGGQKILDLSTPTGTLLGTYRSPGSVAWPPPNNGIYAPRQARLFKDLAFSSWMSDGLRVVDISDPRAPREVASFVPPDVADPSRLAGAGPTNQRGKTGSLLRGQSWPDRALVTGVQVVPKGERSGLVVISDINGGLYVLSFEANLVTASEGKGYWSVASDGGIFAFGAAPFLGSMGGKPLTSPVVGMAPTPSGKGYWLVARDGGIFAFGDAGFFGSTGAMRLNRPVVGMTPTPSGKGYWLVASDGGIFAFGDAAFFGSTGARTLNRPIVGMAATPTGKGYWLVASDGGIFAFGDAAFFGSTGAMTLNRPVVGMAPSATGKGYLLVASDGGIFAFGDGQFRGSTGAIRLNSPMVGMSRAGNGYYLVASDGGIFAFGNAGFFGSAGSLRLASPVVGTATLPQ